MKKVLVTVLIFALTAPIIASSSNTRAISYQDYFDKVYGGWLGKISGLTLGVPKEFSEPWPPSEVSYFAEVPDYFSGLYSGDDPYFPLLAQLCLKKYGLHPTQEQYMQEWTERLYRRRGFGNCARRFAYRPAVDADFPRHL
jgi:hypothetical protein